MTSLFAEGVGDGNKKDLPPQYARNPLKTLNSEEAAKGNERKQKGKRKEIAPVRAGLKEKGQTAGRGALA
jgi:hypothetical protein